MNFITLGYQIRVAVSQIEELDSELRSGFLLNPSTEIQLSVDPSVWPERQDAAMYELLFEDAPQSPNDRPNGLDLYRLKTLTAEIVEMLRSFDGCLIELSVLESDAERLTSLHAIEPHQGVYSEFGRWDALGIDVCDDWRKSAVANVDIGGSWSEIRRVHGAHTNAWGLFSSVEAARSYADRFAQLVPEHAPFSPWRIRRFAAL